MFQKVFQYNNYLALIVMVFFNAACIRQSHTVRSDGEKAERPEITIQSSFKTVEGNLTLEKEQYGSSKSTVNVKEGKCVYGCIDTTPDKRNTEKSELVGVTQNTGSLPSSKSSFLDISQDYILGPEDVLDVSVWKNDNLSRVVFIRPDGKISLPLIGDVQAAGLTTNQLKDSIKERLKEYKETPEVAIIVKEINSLVVFVAGEVLHPGKLMLRSNTTLLQAIILSGGFTQFASPNKIVVLRKVAGIETRKHIRYKDIVSGKVPDQDILLQRGDTIIVP